MDRIIFIAISLISIVIVLIKGDFIHVGIWYYLAIPIVAYLLSLPFQPQNFFLTGVSLTILLSYIPYFYYNITVQKSEGLLGLGHFSSMFGLALGIILAGFYLKEKSLKPLSVLTISLVISFSGFLLSQLVVCNTLMYCGNLLSSS
jgi:hypothetical protein